MPLLNDLLDPIFKPLGLNLIGDETQGAETQGAGTQGAGTQGARTQGARTRMAGDIWQSPLGQAAPAPPGGLMVQDRRIDAAAGGGAQAGGLDFLQRVQQNLGFGAGTREACQMAMNRVYGDRGPGTTKAASDGLASGENLASRWAGDDVGEFIKDRNQLRTGDVLHFKNTYGNWKPGTITHVGTYLGRDADTGEQLMADHSSRHGLMVRGLDTFGDKFIGGRRFGAAGRGLGG